ncbi:MAG: carboxypeptidase-like regulatory domain-containing protein [Bacteroidales bacterium]|nr:carboxypeptidase-like regulatory domain-containing protein [Bacteroidales bacterium]
MVHSQERYRIDWDYKDLSFKEFVINAEKQLNVRFFYKDEWTTDLRLGNYQGVTTLTGVLDNLFREKSLFYFIDESGNIVITKTYAVKIDNKRNETEDKFIPPTEYADNGEGENKTGNTFVEIGNPADRNKPGNVVVSGYITSRETKEPIAGVTVFVQKLSVGTISNAYGFYTLTLPRGLHLLQFSFIGLKEKTINLNLNSTGEMNIDMNSVLIPLKETVISAQKT